MMERLINALEKWKLKDYKRLTQTATKLFKKKDKHFTQFVSVIQLI